MHQPRKAPFVQRPYNPGNPKNFSQHYGSYTQPLQGDAAFNQANGNGTNRVHVASLAGYQHAPSQTGNTTIPNPHLRTQPSHAVVQQQQGHSMHGVSSGSSSQNIQMNAAQVSAPSSVTSATHPHDIAGMPLSQSITNSGVPTLQPQVMYQSGGPQPGQQQFYTAPQVTQQRLVQSNHFVFPYQQGLMQMPGQFTPHQHMTTTRQHFAGQMPIQAQGFAPFPIQGAYNQGAQGAQQPHPQAAQAPPPPAAKAPPRVKNPIRIVNPVTGQEVEIKDSTEEQQAPSQPPPSREPESASSMSDAAQEFATKVAASVNKETPQEKAPEEGTAPIDVVEETPVVAADTVDCKAPLMQPQIQEVPKLVAPKEQKAQKRRKTPSPDITKEQPKEAKPQVPVKEVKPAPQQPTKAKEEAPKPKGKSKSKNQNADKEPAVVIPQTEAKTSAEVQFGDVQVAALHQENTDKHKQAESNKAPAARPAPVPEPKEPQVSSEAPPKKETPEPKEQVSAPPAAATDAVPQSEATPAEAAKADPPAEQKPAEAAPTPFRVEDYVKDGVIQYPKELIMSLQRTELSMEKPVHLPPLDIIRNEPHSKPYDSNKMKDFYPFSNNHGGRNSQHGNFNNRSRKGESQRRDGYAPMPPPVHKVINFPMKAQEFKNKADKPWKSERQAGPAVVSLPTLEVRLRKVRGVLNKLTPDNFAKSISTVMQLDLGGPEETAALGKLIFEKAANEAHFGELYSRLVKELDDDKKKLRKDIITRCQNQFEGTYKYDDNKKDKYVLDIEHCEKNKNEARKELRKDPKNEDLLTRYKVCEKLWKDALYNKEVADNKRASGTVVFVGHLYLSSQVAHHIMVQVMETLIEQRSELSMTCMFKFLEVIGKTIESKIPQAKEEMRVRYANVFRALEGVSRDKEVTFRARCFAMECLELRAKDWVPRNEKVKPTTTQEIQEKARQEQNERDLQKYQDRYDNPPRDNFPMKKNNPHEWNMAGPQKTRNERFDFNKNPIKRHAQDRADQLSLRPTAAMAVNWGGGSSGGINTTGNNDAASSDNRFSILLNQDMGGARQSMNYSRVAGSTKSTPGPGARKEGGSRSGSADPRGKSTSQTREVTPVPRAPQVDMSSPDPLVAVGEFKNEKIECIAEASVKEFVSGDGKVVDLVHDVKKLESEVNAAIYAEYFFQHGCQSTSRNKELGSVFKELCKTHKLFSSARYVRAVKCFAEYIDDMKCDLPFIYRYASDMLAGMMDKEIFSEEVLRSCLAGVPGEEKLLKMTLESYHISLPADNKNMEYVQKKIFYLVQNDKIEECTDYIKTDVQVDKDSEDFVKGVTHALVKSCLDLANRTEQEVPFNDAAFEKRLGVLQMCIDNYEDRELYAIYALQSLCHELQHPLKLFSTLLAALLQNDVVAEETVNEWRTDERPERQEGKGVCASSASTVIRYIVNLRAES